MKRYLVSLVMSIVASAMLLSSSALGVEDIIVEAASGGKNTNWYKETSGAWADSIAKSFATGVSRRPVGSRYVATETPASAQAVFQPVIPQEGQWEISVTWGMSANAYHVKYVVFDGTKEQVKYLDQAGWGGELSANQDAWLSLGIFNLPAGSKAYVKIDASEVTGKPSKPDNGRVYTDAVRFHFVPPGTSPSPTLVPIANTPTPAPPTPVPPTPTPSPSVTATSEPPQGASAEWLNDYAQALGEGKRRNKYILLFFHYPPAVDSQRMNDETMNNPKVVDELNRFVCCKLNPVEAQQIANYYTVVKAPVVLVLDSNGYLRGRHDGYSMIAIFLNFLAQYK
jgi:hypothetical protein